MDLTALLSVCRKPERGKVFLIHLLSIPGVLRFDRPCCLPLPCFEEMLKILVVSMVSIVGQGSSTKRISEIQKVGQEMKEIFMTYTGMQK